MSIDDRLVDDLLNLSRLVRRRTHPVRRAEITPEQYWLLKRVKRRGPVSVGALAEGLGLTSGSVTIACKRLEKAGLLRRSRQQNQDDERVVLISLTDEGVAQLDAWQEERRAFLGQILTSLNAAEQAQLLHLLERVLAATEASTAGEFLDDGAARDGPGHRNGAPKEANP